MRRVDSLPLITCALGLTAAVAVGVTRAVAAQGPPPADLIPCGVPQGPAPGSPQSAGAPALPPLLSGGGVLQAPVTLPSGLRLRPVQGNVYMLSGAGANIAVQVGSDGVLLVDSGRADTANAVVAAVRQLTAAPIRLIINTAGDADHAGGNDAVGRAGSRLTSAIGGGGDTPGAAIMARQAVMDRLIKEKAPECALPTTTYDTVPTRSLFFNGEGIELRHMAAAHSDGDSFVFFRRSDVVSTGEIFNPNLYPFIDLDHGGSIGGVVAALNELLEITIPALKQEGGTYVIPAHGHISDEADVSEYRDMVTIVRDRVRALIARKMTLAQVKAERPTLDYDGRYGGTDGPWTPDRFVEAVYTSLSRTAALSAPRTTTPAPGPRATGGQRR
jgi:cyclase